MTSPNFAKGKLQQLVAKIERLEEEKRALAADIAEVYKEAKAGGFSTKIMRKAVRRRATPKVQRDEDDALLDLYMTALEVATVVPMRVVEPTHAAAAE